MEWSAAMETAVLAAKAALCQASTLVHPDSTADPSLMVDASETHVGAVLQQRARFAHLAATGIFLHKLAAAQTRYSAFDRELLAMGYVISATCWKGSGSLCSLITSRLPLLLQQAEPWSADQQRHFSYIAKFLGDINPHGWAC